MASSLIGGLLGGGTPATNVAVVDPDDIARQRMEQNFGITSDETVAAGIGRLSGTQQAQSSQKPLQLGVVIAVKPHIVESVCSALNHFSESDSPSLASRTIEPVFISVAAGVRASSMSAWLPDEAAIVRCMPNTPALLGLGATALYASGQCSKGDRQIAEALLDSAGISLWVESEEELDAVTAVSGSGPAYFFYLIEHMIDAGVELGLSRSTAETLAIETAFGAASMARERTHTPAVLRENVTSKGGTTAAALSAFDEQGTPGIILSALRAAQMRAIEIGDELTS